MSKLLVVESQVDAPNGAIKVGRNRPFPYTREGLHEFIHYAMDRYACCFEGSPLRRKVPQIEPVTCTVFFHPMVLSVFNEVSASLCAACGIPVSQAFSRERQNAPVCFVRAGIIAMMRRVVFMRRWRKLGTTRGRPQEFIDWRIIRLGAPAEDFPVDGEAFLPISTIALAKLMLLDESSVRKLAVRWAADEFRFRVP